MIIGIDDTDSPDGMCTTYIGAVLARRLKRDGIGVTCANLVRLNPNVPWKTRGNAAISLECTGDAEKGFSIACRCVEDLAEFGSDQTHPGVVVVEEKPPAHFYYRALREFCTIDEARTLLDELDARNRGYKLGRGLIGALAAVCCAFPDATWEILAYRDHMLRRVPRRVERESFFQADAVTFPHTWDTVDRINNVVVCVPHTPDPVIFGIRGESPAQIERARALIRSEPPCVEQVWKTNQGTDAHLVCGTIGNLTEGTSYCLTGTVTLPACTRRGGHVELEISEGEGRIRCMAYEPTKGFRNIVRALHTGDRIRVTGSYKNESLNLEKLGLIAAGVQVNTEPPVCCGKRMTSAGRGKGLKCRRCGSRSPAVIRMEKTTRIAPVWYEVPSCARRHLAKPLCRGPPVMLQENPHSDPTPADAMTRIR